MSVSLCLLVWNEAHGCETELPKIDFSLFDQVFAIDGGSTDGTIEILENAGIEVRPQSRRSYFAAYIDALNFFDTDSVVLYHPKGTIDPSSLPVMVDLLNKGNDLVIASRMMPGAVNEEDDQIIRHRKWFGEGLALASSVRWNRNKAKRITDPLHGYRGCSRKFAHTLNLRPTGVTADLEMVQHAYESKARIVEFPIQESMRAEGTTHFPAYKTGKELLKYLIWQ
jgi:glycosyltransferase involved in cell wall biosynthesis